MKILVGEALVGLVAALGIRNWRAHQLALGIPMLAMVFLSCYLPESKRWKEVKSQRHAVGS